ncbi:MAG: DUF4418 family protein [Oscillospiraceae bacterium]|nr:DUF4418 family protein [Oscillospiraceae bacterium]
MKKPHITDILLLVMSAALCIGVKLLFHACAPKEDGSWMACHWAEQAVFAASLGMSLTAFVRLFLDRRARAGAALGMSITAAVTAFIPGVFIRLCMMNDMRCHAVMRPAAVILCVLIVICGIADFVLARKEAAA